MFELLMCMRDFSVGWFFLFIALVGVGSGFGVGQFIASFDDE